MKKILKEKSKELIKVTIALAVIILVSVGIFMLAKAFGITDIDNLHEFISNCGVWGWLVFLLVQIICTVLLCFVPGTSMTFTALGVLLYGANYKAFLLVFSGIVISSIVMDSIGRFGGSKLIIKLIGQDDYESALKLVKTKGEVYVPIMYSLPVFPDDAICMCCGATKIKWWLHYIYIVLFRGIGCATIVFGVNLLPTELTNNITNLAYVSDHLWEYITMITVIAFWICMLFVFARKIDKFLTLRRKLKDERRNEKN